MQKDGEKISYCVCEFMRELGLKNSELKIYAFFYSYRKSEFGFYFGKRSFISEECGVSQRTVERVIPALLKKGLIKTVTSGDFVGYACAPEFMPKESGETACDFEEDGEFFRTDIKPKHEIVTLGHYVTMTREQCEELLHLLPISELEVYAAKMDRMLEKNWASGIRPPKSYYRTLKKWIIEDCKV